MTSMQEAAKGRARSATALLKQSVKGCLETAIGPAGLSPATIETWTARIDPAVAAFRDDAR